MGLFDQVSARAAQGVPPSVLSDCSPLPALAETAARREKLQVELTAYLSQIEHAVTRVREIMRELGRDQAEGDGAPPAL